MKVSELTVDELVAVVRSAVHDAMHDEWDDDGPLRPEFIAELEASLATNDDEGISLAEMRRRLNARA